MHRIVLCLVLQIFITYHHLNVTQLLTGYTILYSQSEVVLHSSVQHLGEKRQIVLRMVGEYGPRTVWLKDRCSKFRNNLQLSVKGVTMTPFI